MRGGLNKGVIGVLDLGSSKVCCVIAERPASLRTSEPLFEQFRILGVGHFRSGGVKSGVIVDLDAAELAVRAAVAQAEHEAGVRLDEIYVGISCGRLKSLNFRAEAELARGLVSLEDLANLAEAAREYAANGERTLVHLNEVDFQIDGCAGIHDPRGLTGQKLGVDLHAITSDAAPLRNVSLLAKRCFLKVAGFVPAGYASALSATTAEEREAGVVSIDIGGGAMAIAGFVGGRFVHMDVVPFGASSITTDIARELAVSFDEAERLKALNGSVLHAVSDETEVIAYTAIIGGRPVRKTVVRADIRRLVEHRLGLLLQLVSEQLESSALEQFAGCRVVMTGGGSQLLGLAEFAANFLGRPVRAATPRGLDVAGDALQSAAFSAVTGMLAASLSANHLLTGKLGGESGLEGPLGRVGRWLRESF